MSKSWALWAAIPTVFAVACGSSSPSMKPDAATIDGAPGAPDAPAADAPVTTPDAPVTVTPDASPVDAGNATSSDGGVLVPQVDPLVDIPTAGSCSTSPSACMDELRQLDGVSLQYLACTDGLNTSTEYDNPTTLVFDASATAKSRTLTITAYAPGSTTADIQCVDETQASLAVLAQAVAFSPTVQTYQWGVPPECVTPTAGNPTVRIEVNRTGAFCLAPDLIQLTRR